MAPEFKRDHRCSNIPNNTQISLRYTPCEVQWYLRRSIEDCAKSVVKIKIPISHCPYCGMELLH